MAHQNIAVNTWYNMETSYMSYGVRSGPEPAILDWYGHYRVNKLGGSGGMLPQEKILN